MNLNQPNEKCLFWHANQGFLSEDSENEKTKFNTFHRRFMRDRQA